MNLSGEGPSIKDDAIVRSLASVLDDALQLMREAQFNPVAAESAQIESATLLQQCLSLCEQRSSDPPEPLRMVHHFACTGGTLICKCLGAMPNVQLLSEVDPLSPLASGPSSSRFAPTDMNLLLRYGTRDVGREVLIELFRAELQVVRQNAIRHGLHLVLRDHAHSHFCTGIEDVGRPSLRELVAVDAPVLSILTVRHPADSFVSLIDNGWAAFEPATFAEYCRRYLTFLERHRAIRVFRYEDFLLSPQTEMHGMCNELALPFNAAFCDLIGTMHLSGDSGRASDEISPRPRRAEAHALLASAATVPEYCDLKQRLGY